MSKTVYGSLMVKQASAVPVAEPRVQSDQAPQAWIEALERSELDLAAGHTVDASVVHERLSVSIALVEARLAARRR